MTWLDRQLVDPSLRLEFESERLLQEITAALSSAIEDANLTQAEVASRLGKSSAFVSQILSGRRNATISSIAQIAWAARVRLVVETQFLQPCVSGVDANQVSSVLTSRRFKFHASEQPSFHPESDATSEAGAGVAA